VQHRRVLVALIPLLAAVGCGTTPTATSTPTPTSTSLNTPANIADIEALLGTRATSLTSPDQAAFDQTLLPGDRKLRGQEDALFANLRQFPGFDVSYKAYQPLGSGTATNAITSFEGGLPHLRMDVDEFVWLDSSTQFPIDVPVTMTFVKKNGTWYIAAESEPKFYAKRTYVRPWWGAPVRVGRARGVIAVVDSTSSVTAATLARRTAETITADQQVLRLGGAAPPVLVDATTNGTVRNWEHNSVGALFLSDSAASSADQNTYLIKANPTHVSQLLQDTQTLRHEIAHLLLARIDDHAATWAREGIAEYVGSYPTEVTFTEYDQGKSALMDQRRALPASTSWGSDPKYDYSVAHAAVLALIKRSGVPMFLKFLAAYTADTDAASDAQTAGLLKRFYGITPAQLVSDAYTQLSALPIL
jgi:hypothetical protein